MLRYSGLHPYVVFVASPRLERLHITRKMGLEKQKRRLCPSSSQLNLDDPPVYTVRLYITTTHGYSRLWIVAGLCISWWQETLLELSVERPKETLCMHNYKFRMAVHIYTGAECNAVMIDWQCDAWHLNLLILLMCLLSACACYLKETTTL